MAKVNTFSSQDLIVHLKPAAHEHIKKFLAQHEDKVGLRFLVKKTGCSGYGYVAELMSEVRPNQDFQVAKESGLSLYLDASSASKLNGMTIDYVKKSLGQSQLIYDNPNEKDRCGCGESFRIEEDDDQ